MTGLVQAGVNAAAINSWQVIAKSATQVSYTGGTGEQTLATITIPANTLGPNGVVVVTFQMGFAGANGNRTPRAYFGGTKYYEAAFANTQFSSRGQFQVQNRNATNSQVGNGAGQVNFSSTTSIVTTSAVDTTAAVTILITGQLANGADTISLESYTVEVNYGA